MLAMLQRLLGFDRLMGPALVRIVYYVGAAIILMLVGFAVLMAVLALFAGNVGQGLMQIVAAPTVGAVAFIGWRFFCELCMLAFLSYERLVEIRERLPDYSGF
jgi:membrane-bound acyltransferase YfiQ involved in biofilm formation